jgi:hypothetical protein
MIHEDFSLCGCGNTEVHTCLFTELRWLSRYSYEPGDREINYNQEGTIYFLLSV